MSEGPPLKKLKTGLPNCQFFVKGPLVSKDTTITTVLGKGKGLVEKNVKKDENVSAQEVPGGIRKFEEEVSVFFCVQQSSAFDPR